MEIKKLKLKKEGVVITYETQKRLKNGEISYITRTDVDDAEPHEDLFNAVKAFTPHLIALADQKNDKSVEVTGVSLKGEGDEVKIVITGKKNTDNGVVPINTPFIAVYGTDYVGEEKLIKAVTNLKSEAEAYLDGKAGESNQLDMFKPLEAENLEDGEEETF